MEPVLNNKTKKLDAIFNPCNFKDEQKWDYVQVENGSGDGGQIINKKTGHCLTFDKQNGDSAKADTKKKKEKMLSFLSKIVKETIMKAEIPYISDCEMIENLSGPIISKELQKWRMTNLLNSKI